MIKKTYTKTGKSCRVTFKLPAADARADQAVVLGEFNEWDPQAHPMKKRKDGSFSTTLSLEAGQEYRFRYLLDGETWENDNEADRLSWNRFGGKDGVIAV